MRDFLRIAGCALSVVVCCGPICGCGGSDYEVVPVSGRVTLDGKPVAGARVFFQPTAGGADRPNVGPGSSGKTDAYGRFTLTTTDGGRGGAVPGKHVVRMTTIPRQEGIPVEGSTPPVETLLPKRCGDGSLRFNVPPAGTDRADFDITSP